MSIGWQWFFNIIGVVAFLMAFPFVLQLIFGQPKIGFVFSIDDTGTEGRLLTISLSNMPVDDPILKLIRVTRLPVQDLAILLRVTDAQNGNVIADGFIPKIKLSQKEVSMRTSLPASIILSNIEFVRWKRIAQSAVLFAQNEIPLVEGVYSVNLRIEMDGKSMIFIKPILFYVGNSEVELTWNKGIMNKYLMQGK